MDKGLKDFLSALLTRSLLPSSRLGGAGGGVVCVSHL